MGSQVTKKNFRLAMTSLFFWFSVYLFLPVLPIFYHKIGIDNEHIGLLIGSFSVGALLFRFISGKFSDLLGCKWVSLLGLAVSFLSIFFYFCTTNWIILLAARFTHGVGSALYGAAAITMVTLTNKNTEIKEAVSFYMLLSMIGIGVSTALAFIIYTHFNIEVIIFLSIVLTGFSAIIFPNNSKFEPVIQNRAEQKKVKSFKNILCNPNVYRPTINQFFVYFTYSTIIVFFPIMFASGNPKQHLWLFYTFYALTVVLSRLLIKRISLFLSNNATSILVLFSISLGLLIVSFSNSILVLPVVGILIGLSVGLATPTFIDIITAHTPASTRGTAVGIFSTAIDLGMGSGSMFIGLILGHFSYRLIFLILGALSIINMILFIIHFSKEQDSVNH